MTRLAHNNFPFTAVAGQDTLKLALILCAINPQIGGVLISGPRGSAKSTLARGLSGVMPALDNFDEQAPFATLPLGISEDRLLGALDLDKVLQDKQVHFNPGVLSKAHGGVLYVDEVNLLADHLVDQLLDVSASGVNRVERDGVSHEHDARFLLVGTMNPDEGELRPQLQDRFGLMVALSNQYSLQERVEIVRLRDEFDQDPVAFIQSSEASQNALKTQIQSARHTLKQVKCADELRMEIATRCQDANVDGVRSDIVWVRAAMTHAAWRGSEQVTLHDIEQVEELVLAHRRQAHSNSSSNQASKPHPSNTEAPLRRPQESKLPRSQPEPDDEIEKTSSGEWGSMAPQSQASSAAINVPVQGEKHQSNLSANSLSEVAPGKSKGKQRGGYRPDAANAGKNIDWFRSITRRPHEWPPKELAYKAEKTGQPVLHLVLLDTSASTLSQGVFGKAKGVILDIAQRAYLAREEISILGFGQDNVSPILPKIRAPKEITALLDNLDAGGGTPFRLAIEQAAQYLEQQHKQNQGLHSQTYLLTDGRTQDSVVGLRLQGNTVLIDTESSPIKRGRGKDIAQALRAEYILLDSVVPNLIEETSL